MKITFTGDNVEITDSIRNYTDDNFQRFENHFHFITSIHVTFEVEKRDQIAKATIHVPGKELYASASSEELYSSIDMLTDKLEEQLKRYKEKMQDHRD